MLISSESSVKKGHIRRDKTDLLKHTFTLMTIAGCWRPLSWISSYKCKLYNIYTLFVVLLLYTFAISQFMAIILNTSNPEEFTSILYIMMAACIASFKISTMWMYHKDLVKIINILTDKPFRPMTNGEMKIRQNFDKMIG